MGVSRSFYRVRGLLGIHGWDSPTAQKLQADRANRLLLGHTKTTISHTESRTLGQSFSFNGYDLLQDFV
ncbi:hypothetical protein ACN4EG_04755 [Alkalinema pantanalense CENA528]|uniref:hypothetical protein n=1 Tax=Alkalinema pantanalense TaxID=1620705 RepID=UPI003D7007F7